MPAPNAIVAPSVRPLVPREPTASVGRHLHHIHPPVAVHVAELVVTLWPSAPPSITPTWLIHVTGVAGPSPDERVVPATDAPGVYSDMSARSVRSTGSSWYRRPYRSLVDDMAVGQPFDAKGVTDA